MTELQKPSRSRTGAGSVALSARMMLQAGEGESNCQIGLRFGVKAHTVGTSRSRFESSGCGGLSDLQRLGRPTKIAPAQKQTIVHTVCRKPPSGLGRWNVGSLAKGLGINCDAVYRTLVEHDLRPHRLRTCKLSPDPRFEEKVLDVVGIYMTPPENALVLCVDEKTRVQALDRTQPMLPLKAGKPRTWSNEYLRHCTRALLESLDISIGEIVAQVTRDRKSSTFLKFMEESSGLKSLSKPALPNMTTTFLAMH